MAPATAADAVVFIAPDGTRWVRTGTCNRCGLCCTGDPTGGTVKTEVKGYCPHFRWDAEGKGTCAIWGVKGSYWDLGCRVWPVTPDELSWHPYCSFRFERKG